MYRMGEVSVPAVRGIDLERSGGEVVVAIAAMAAGAAPDGKLTAGDRNEARTAPETLV